MNIRPYRDADLEPIVTLFTASVHVLGATHYDAAQRAAWAPRPPDYNHWQARLAATHTVVADNGSQLVGFISYEQNGHISLLYTSPAFQRCGVASLLYRYVESTLSVAGPIELFTEASLVACPFFERQGFHVTEAQYVRIRGVSFLRYAMCKSI